MEPNDQAARKRTKRKQKTHFQGPCLPPIIGPAPVEGFPGNSGDVSKCGNQNIFSSRLPRLSTLTSSINDVNSYVDNGLRDDYRHEACCSSAAYRGARYATKSPQYAPTFQEALCISYLHRKDFPISGEVFHDGSHWNMAVVPGETTRRKNRALHDPRLCAASSHDQAARSYPHGANNDNVQSRPKVSHRGRVPDFADYQLPISRREIIPCSVLPPIPTNNSLVNNVTVGSSAYGQVTSTGRKSQRKSYVDVNEAVEARVPKEVKFKESTRVVRYPDGGKKHRQVENETWIPVTAYEKYLAASFIVDRKKNMHDQCEKQCDDESGEESSDEQPPSLAFVRAALARDFIPRSEYFNETELDVRSFEQRHDEFKDSQFFEFMKSERRWRRGAVYLDGDVEFIQFLTEFTVASALQNFF